MPAALAGASGDREIFIDRRIRLQNRIELVLQCLLLHRGEAPSCMMKNPRITPLSPVGKKVKGR